MRPREIQVVSALVLAGCVLEFWRTYALRGMSNTLSKAFGGQSFEIKDIPAVTPQPPTPASLPQASASAALALSKATPASLRATPVLGQRLRSAAERAWETDPSQIDCTSIRFVHDTEALPKTYFNRLDLTDFARGMATFPCKVNSSDEADFVMASGHHSCKEVPQLLALPPRPPTRPYVVWWDCHKDSPALRARPDFIFSALDLLDWNLWDDSAPWLEGATIAPAHWAKIRGDPQVPPKYFLTFQGKVNQRGHTTRDDLAKSFDGYENIRPDVFVKTIKKQTNKPDFWSLANTAYALVPRGHYRWTYRFSEMMGTCAIPVVLSNNWSLPFAPIVNWSEAVICLEQRYAKNATELLSMLPTDPEVIRKMREKSCEIADRFFATEEKRIHGFFLSLKAVVAKRAGRRNGTSTEARAP